MGKSGFSMGKDRFYPMFLDLLGKDGKIRGKIEKIISQW
jgi:hypothetical protein